MSISGAGVDLCVCACAHGFDQLELVCSVTVAQQQSLLHMDEKRKLSAREREPESEEAKMMPNMETGSWLW